MDDKSKNKITVIGSGNCDIFIITDRMPSKGETLSAKSLLRAPGGKGSNQAVAIGKQGFTVDMVGQYGNDDSGKILVNALNEANVNTDHMTKLDGVETGQAYIFSYPGDNSIIIYGAANMAWDNNDLALFKESIKTCIVLL